MMHDYILFWIPGDAQPRQGDRTRVVTPKGKPSFVHHYQKKTGPKAEWVATVRLAAEEHRPDELWDGPVAMGLVFVRLKPKSWPKFKMWPYKIPDLDNLEKPLIDALRGVILHDDSRVVVKISVKAYGHRPGALVAVVPIKHDEYAAIAVQQAYQLLVKAGAEKMIELEV